MSQYTHLMCHLGILWFLIDVLTRWSHVCLLSTRNIAFARLLAQIIRLQFLIIPLRMIYLNEVRTEIWILRI